MRHELSRNNGSAVKSQDPGPGNTDGPSFIGLSLSCDGRDWAPLMKVATTTGRSGRTDDQVKLDDRRLLISILRMPCPLRPPFLPLPRVRVRVVASRSMGCSCEAAR